MWFLGVWLYLVMISAMSFEFSLKSFSHLVDTVFVHHIGATSFLRVSRQGSCRRIWASQSASARPAPGFRECSGRSPRPGLRPARPSA